jgi:hypothetical protein
MSALISNIFTEYSIGISVRSFPEQSTLLEKPPLPQV